MPGKEEKEKSSKAMEKMRDLGVEIVYTAERCTPDEVLDDLDDMARIFQVRSEKTRAGG